MREEQVFSNFVFRQGAVLDAKKGFVILASRKRIQNKPHDKKHTKLKRAGLFIEKRRDIHDHKREFWGFLENMNIWSGSRDPCVIEIETVAARKLIEKIQRKLYRK